MYSFGHLRIQEFLASEELSTNRSIDIAPLVSNDWWSGALYLYGFSNDAQPVIDDIYNRYGNFIRYKAGIESMIRSQPTIIQDSLLLLMKEHERLDNFSGFDEDGFYYKY